MTDLEDKRNEITQEIIQRYPSWWNSGAESNNYQLAYAFSNELAKSSLNIDDLHIEIYVNTASGERLDDIGEIFKLKRKSAEEDEDYRARIKAYWPGYSGGGTAPAIKSTVNRMTGLPEADVIVTDINYIKFKTEILLDSLADVLLKDTIFDTIWNIKAAGVYPFFEWTLGGDLLDEALEVSDSVSITYVSTSPWFIVGQSLIGGAKVIW